MKKYAVPFTVDYDNFIRQWEVQATTKKEAREIAVRELSSDRCVNHIGSVAHIVSYGEVSQYTKTNS